MLKRGGIVTVRREIELADMKVRNIGLDEPKRHFLRIRLDALRRLPCLRASVEFRPLQNITAIAAIESQRLQGKYALN
jgi:hypothetical protein